MGVNVESFSRSLVEENPKIYQLTEPTADPSIAEHYFKSNPRQSLAGNNNKLFLLSEIIFLNY